MIGNQLYKDGYLDKAIDKYLYALSGLEMGESEEERRVIRDTLQIPTLLNISACYLELKVKGNYKFRIMKNP